MTPSPRQVCRTTGKQRKRLHFSDKRDRCSNCSTFLSENDHRFCGNCTVIPDHVDDNTIASGNIESPNEAEETSNAEVFMVETVQFEKDTIDIEECSATSSRLYAGQEPSNDLTWSDNDEDSSHSSFNEDVAVMTAYTTNDHLPNPRAGIQYIPVRECLSQSYKENPEDKAIVGILLKVLHHTGSDTAEKTVRYNGQSGNTRQRHIAKQPYDRMFTFGDVNDPGVCFAIICKTHQETRTLLKRCSKSQEGVGNVFVIVEPDAIEYFLGDSTSVPIVESPQDFFPINNPMDTVVPQTMPTMPEADHMLYFALHGEKITCKRTTLKEGVCSGVFCDRQLVNVGSTHNCGCLYMSAKDRYDSVLNMDVTFTVPPSFHVESKATVAHFQSWKFSNIFVPKETTWTTLNKDEDFQVLRQSVATITEYINNNGGWTIVGWIRSGHIHDQSSDTVMPDNLTSLHPKPHISYLQPTNHHITKHRNLKQHQVKKKITPNNT